MAAKHWTVEDIESEVKAMRVLIQARPGKNDLASKLPGQLKHKLENMHSVSANQLVVLYDLVKNCGLPDSMKDELSELLDRKATDDSSTSKPGSQADCFNLIDFFTATELKQLETCSMWQGASIVASRLKMLGFRAMKESTKKSATAILVWFETKRAQQSPPDGDTIYSFVSAMCITLSSQSTTPVPAGVPSLGSLPDSPKHLSTEHFKAAYPDEAPATGKSFPGLAEMRKHHAWVRNSSNSVSHQGKKKVTRVKAFRKFFSIAKIMKLSTVLWWY